MLGARGGAGARSPTTGSPRSSHASVRAGLRARAERRRPRARADRAARRAVAWPTTPRGALALGALNGMWGDRIERDHAPLALGMDLRHRRRAETGKLAVFAHGLCETDAAWALGGGPDLRRAAARGPRPHARLRPLQHRPPHLRQRARAGRGARGARRRWPVRSRRSCSSGTRWAASSRAARATTASATATPGRGPAPRRLPRLTAHGAPLERAAARGSHLLGRLPETAPLARAAHRPQRRREGPPLRRLPGGGLGGVDPDEWGPDRCARLPVPARGDLLLRRRDARARQGRRRSGASSATCSCSSRAPRATARCAARVRARPRAAPRRRQPPAAAQPPARLRAAGCAGSRARPRSRLARRSGGPPAAPARAAG